MKRLSVLILCLFLFTACFQTAAMAANIEDADAYPLAEGDSINANSISIWGNYIFASTIDNGLEIIDMEDNSVIATWHLDDTEIIPGLGSFASVQTVVTDEYIICANSLYVVVFPNEGKFTDTPPELVARITPNPSNAKRTFNELKRMFVQDGFLYLFDLTAKNQLDAVDGAADNAVVWKVPLESFAEIDYTYESLKWAGLESMSGVEFSVIGNYQYFWDTIKIDGNSAYCVTYNDELLLPKKTLFLNIVNLETLETSVGEVMQNSASGLQTTFEVEGSMTMEEIRELELYVARVDETEHVPLSSFLDVENTEYLMVDIDEADGVSTVKIMFSADVISALVDIFDCSENQIVNNGIVFAVDVDEEQHEFVYITNESCYDTGVIAIDSEKNNVFVMTGSATGDNMLIAVSCQSLDKIRPISKKLVTPIGSYNIAVDAIVADHSLIALYKGVSSRAAVYDISNPGSIPYNFERNLELRSGIYLSNTLSQMVHYGNKYYYADTMGRYVGVLTTNESATFANIFQESGEMPVRVYGYSSDEETVLITLDGEDTVEVPVYNGVWSYTVGMAENGAHTIDVEIGGYSKTFDYTVDVILPVTVDEIGYNEYDELYATITNHTDKYDKSLHTEDIKAIAVLYDEEGNASFISEVDEEILYGESKDVTFTDILSFDVEDVNGTIKVYILNEALAPLTTAYTYEDETLSDADIPTVTGKIAGITFDTPAIDANNKTMEIGGTVACDGTRPVLAVISVDGYIYDVQQTVCDDDGNFSFKYSYVNDAIAGEGVYDVTVNAMMGGEANAIEEQITIMDSELFDANVEYIIDNIETAEDLIEYLEENEKFSRELGLNMDNENYQALSDSDKETVMGQALTTIKSGDRTTLSETFKSESQRLKHEADVENAIEEINGATKASLQGILEKHKDLIGISDETWEEYTGKSSKKVGTINKEFLKKDITDLADVEKQLEDAMEKAEEAEEEESTKVGGGGNVGGGYTIPSQPIEVQPVNPDLVYDPDEIGFTDLGSAAWAETAIISLAEQGIVNGISRTEFLPDGGVTREQFVKMLVIAFGLQDDTAVSSLKDVKSGEWYYEYVAAAEKCGLAQGDGENFGIGRVMTREEMATFAYRAAEIARKTLPEKNEAQQFADNGEIASYALESIEAMQKSGIINGIGGNLFAPKTTCSRAMAAKVVYELLNI